MSYTFIASNRRDLLKWVNQQRRYIGSCKKKKKTPEDETNVTFDVNYVLEKKMKRKLRE